MTNDRLAYGIFQGGGAKGLAHVGALKATEDLNIRFLGIAGASAGAIVAALAAVGYTASELFDPDRPGALVSAIVDALGQDEWKRLKALGRWAARSRDRRFFVAWPSRPIAAAKLLSTAWSRRKSGGYFDTRKLVDYLDRRLRERLELSYSEAEKRGWGPFPNRQQGNVRFREVNRFTPNCTPLKIVVTDLEKNRVVLFSSTDTPDVMVAEAVAASAAFPFLFAPVSITWPDSDGRRPIYTDGGIASNLPVWAYQDEKIADARQFKGTLLTIGFGFEESVKAPQPTGFSPIQLASRLADAALSTGQSVATSFVEELEIVAMPSDLQLISFDESNDRYRHAHDSARERTKQQLEYCLVKRPNLIASILSRFKEAAEKALAAELDAGGGRLRVCAIEPIHSRYRRAPILNFRVVQSLGLDEDADDRMLLDAENPAAPRAFRDHKPVIWSSAPGTEVRQDSDATRFMTKYERALLPACLQSILALPVFTDISNWSRARTMQRDEPLGVVAVDVVGPQSKGLSNLFRKPGLLEIMIRETSGFGEVFLKKWK